MLRKLMYRNFRLVFRLSRWIERRVTPAGGVVVGGMVGAGVFGIDTRQTLAFQVAALCLALLAVAALAALPLRSQLAARRQLPRFTTAGVPLSLSGVCQESRSTGRARLALARSTKSRIAVLRRIRENG